MTNFLTAVNRTVMKNLSYRVKNIFDLVELPRKCHTTCWWALNVILPVCFCLCGLFKETSEQDIWQMMVVPHSYWWFEFSEAVKHKCRHVFISDILIFRSAVIWNEHIIYFIFSLTLSGAISSCSERFGLEICHWNLICGSHSIEKLHLKDWTATTFPESMPLLLWLVHTCFHWTYFLLKK